MLVIADAVERLLDPPTPLFVLGTLIAIVAIVSGCVTKIVVVRAREKTRRELAAYVAEGTLDPDKAVAMIKAGAKIDKEEDDD